MRQNKNNLPILLSLVAVAIIIFLIGKPEISSQIWMWITDFIQLSIDVIVDVFNFVFRKD